MNISKKPNAALGALLLALSLASCGGGAPDVLSIPGNPVTFTATATNSTTVALSWTAVSGAASYTLERKTTGAYTPIPATLGVNAGTYTDAGLTPGTAYTYRLKAANSAGSSGGTERSVTTPAPGDRDFGLTAQPGALTIDAGKSGTVTVTLQRPANPEGTVALTAEGERVGSGADRIGASFGGEGGSTLTLSVGVDVPVGPHVVTVRGTNGDVQKTAQITVNVERLLLVDDDRSTNNWPANNPNTPDSNADTFTRAALTAAGRTFDVRVVPYSGSGQDRDEPSGPTAQEMSRYSGVIWYTGNTTVHPVTSTDRAQIEQFLNGARRKVIVFSPGFVRDATTNGATLAAPRTEYAAFVTGTLGLDKVAFPGSAAFTATGEANTVTQGLSLNVASSVRGFLQPGASARVLLREGANVVASGRTNVGTDGSSKAVLAALSLGHTSGADTATLLTRFLNF